MVPILINKGVFEPSYNDLQFTVRNHNYTCTNLIVFVLQVKRVIFQFSFCPKLAVCYDKIALQFTSVANSKFSHNSHTLILRPSSSLFHSSTSPYPAPASLGKQKSSLSNTPSLSVHSHVYLHRPSLLWQVSSQAGLPAFWKIFSHRVSLLSHTIP